MRIIKRVNPVNQSVLFVVQDESWNGAAAFQNHINAVSSYSRKPYQDIKSFATLQDAKDFAHQYKNNLQPGEEVVCEF